MVAGGQPINLFEYEAAAEKVLPRHLWDFIAGGSQDEITVRRNRSAFEALALRPRYLRDVRERSLETTLLGSPVSMPIFISPAGQQRPVHRDGAVATARAAAGARALMIAPGREVEELAELEPGPRWLQFYLRDRDAVARAVRRAEELGIGALVPTVDVPFLNLKERDRRNNFLPPFDSVLDARHDGPPPGPPSPMQFTWDDLAWLKKLTSLPIVLKGINTAEDAKLAVDNGAAAILVSTHGGRLLDGTMSSIECLPEVVEAVDGAVEVYLDSGIRRGTDVVKALALGARAVGIGRPFFWGLALGGEDGVRGVLETLRAELDTALAFCGQTDVNDLEAGLLHVPGGWGRA